MTFMEWKHLWLTVQEAVIHGLGSAVPPPGRASSQWMFRAICTSSVSAQTLPALSEQPHLRLHREAGTVLRPSLLYLDPSPRAPTYSFLPTQFCEHFTWHKFFSSKRVLPLPEFYFSSSTTLFLPFPQSQRAWLMEQAWLYFLAY